MTLSHALLCRQHIPVHLGSPPCRLSKTFPWINIEAAMHSRHPSILNLVGLADGASIASLGLKSYILVVFSMFSFSSILLNPYGALHTMPGSSYSRKPPTGMSSTVSSHILAMFSSLILFKISLKQARCITMGHFAFKSPLKNDIPYADGTICTALRTSKNTLLVVLCKRVCTLRTIVWG